MKYNEKDIINHGQCVFDLAKVLFDSVLKRDHDRGRGCINNEMVIVLSSKLEEAATKMKEMCEGDNCNQN